MTFRPCAVVVKQLPETPSAKQGRLFFRELESCLKSDRPYIVLDCSKAGLMDSTAIHLMLCCLEEAIKLNGDVKLAAIPQGARGILKLTGADRVFEIFDTNAEAVNSFRRRPVDGASTVDSAWQLKSDF